ncbi:TIGR02391 family protein [Mucilaginibacter ximonensis]|uniref:TIGR02391 family protein n=1 Tax=Mucilaginibacter ximonensis TaxID=538021 RepID=A0ABW5YB22_9SPHI
MAKVFDPIPPQVLEAICRGIGDIGQGLSGTDINKYLQDCRIENPTPDITKWKRLYNAFDKKQHGTGNANDILRFVQLAVHPSRYINFGADYFTGIVANLNQPFSFVGLELGVDGKFRNVIASKTISDAQKRANTLLQKLQAREVHADIYRYCTAELLTENYFHAVFETTKGVADRLRYLSDRTTDGAPLVSEVFASSNPILIINNFTTETDISEHKGFANLLIGFFGMFRNTTAHIPKTSWVMTEQDALEIMTIASLCHRKLDRSHKIR